MQSLPPVLPDVAWRHRVRLGRDHYVRVGTCDYSVHPRAIGRQVDLRVDLDTVTVGLAGQEVGRHARCLARHITLTDPAHVAARAALLRGRSRPMEAQPLVEVRDLAVYDRRLGGA